MLRHRHDRRQPRRLIVAHMIRPRMPQRPQQRKRNNKNKNRSGQRPGSDDRLIRAATEHRNDFEFLILNFELNSKFKIQNSEFS
jgi:hypothetical protein